MENPDKKNSKKLIVCFKLKNDKKIYRGEMTRQQLENFTKVVLVDFCEVVSD